MNIKDINISIDRSLIQTEEEMLALWGEFDKPLVSINCITYNHEKYIRDALDGFLIQKTDFPFEILVHDDASTDGTADIIREYEKRYPKIIKPIYQVENQYSQGKKPSLFNFERAQGEYIAMCEGDDYWIDPIKLKLQCDIFKKRCNVSMVVHPAVQISYVQGRKDITIAGCHGNKDGVLDGKQSFSQINQFCPTSSYVVKRNYLQYFSSFMKDVNPTYGDFFIEAMACRDKFFYCFSPMSIYRRGHKGSYSFRVSKQNISTACNNYKRNIEAVKALKSFTWITEDMILTRIAYIRLDTLHFLFKSHGSDEMKSIISEGPVAFQSKKQKIKYIISSKYKFICVFLSLFTTLKNKIISKIKYYV